MADSTETHENPSSESAPPYQNPADHSWNLQFLLDIKGSIAKLEERTARMQQDVIGIQNDVKGLPGKMSYWTGIGLIVAVLLGLAGIFANIVPKFTAAEPPKMEAPQIPSPQKK